MLSPDLINDETALDERLSRPTAGVLKALQECPGDIIILGVAGKMGLTLARMARRALDELGRTDRVIGVARFSNPEAEGQLQAVGVKTQRCDLLDRDSVERLPQAPNVLFLAGQKFGTRAGPEQTWAMNTLVPAHCAERFSQSRIVVFSTGCVYPLAPVAQGGSREEDPLGPPGDYANSCVGRERIFTYFSKKNSTRVAIFRLNYAIDLRYGVLLDIARRIVSGEPIDVTMGHLNMIWQGDANALALQCLQYTSSPPFVVNITGPEVHSVRALAERLGALLGRQPVLTGEEAPTAWIANSSRAQQLFGPPTVSLDMMMSWVANWVERGGRTFGKPTHFEERGGDF